MNEYETMKTDFGNTEQLSVDESKKILATLSKGLAHPARVEIVRRLAQIDPGTKCVCGDIVKILPLAQSSVSRHLKVLKETGWVIDRIEGPTVCYCLKEGIMDFYTTLIKNVC